MDMFEENELSDCKVTQVEGVKFTPYPEPKRIECQICGNIVNTKNAMVKHHYRMNKILDAVETLTALCNVDEEELIITLIGHTWSEQEAYQLNAHKNRDLQ